jgi:hypothetical protein
MCGNAETLPAWRWNFQADMDGRTDGGTFGILGAIKGMINSIAVFLFLIASLIWVLLLWILRFGFGAEFLNLAAVAVNKGMASIGDFVYALLTFVVLYSVWKVWKLFVAGNLLGVWRQLLRLLVGFGLIFGIVSVANTADTAVGADPEAIVNYKGTVPWAAKTVSDAVAEVPAKAIQLARLSSWGSAVDKETAELAAQEGQGPAPSCESYIATLHDIYSSGDSGGTTAFSPISQFWEQTYYTSWTYAAYGLPTKYKSQAYSKTFSADLASRSMCRWAELKKGTKADEQRRISAEAWDTYEKDLWGANPFVTGSVNTAIFEAAGKDDDPEFDERRAMTAWNACAHKNGSWYTNDSWKSIWIRGGDPTKASDNDKFEGNKKQCTAAFADGKLKVDVSFGSDADSFDLFTKNDAVRYTGDDEAQRATANNQTQAARAWVKGARGDSWGQRMLFGLMAIIVAIMSFYIFGFMAIGLLGAQMMLIGLLILLPVTILLITLDNRTGIKLLKLTGTTLISKTFFTLLITVMVAITSVVQTIAGNIITADGMGSGFASAILMSLAPIGAALSVRMLLQKVGLGDIAKPTGALGFVAGAASRATGDRGGFGDFGKTLGATNLGEKLGGKLDQGAKDAGSGVMKATGGFLARTARGATSGGRQKNRDDRLRRKVKRMQDKEAKKELDKAADEANEKDLQDLRDWAVSHDMDPDLMTLGPAGKAIDSMRGGVPDETIVNPDSTASDDEVEAAAESNRMFTRVLTKDPDRAADARLARVDDLVDGVNARRFGPDFEGFETDTEKAVYMNAFASANAVDVTDVVAGENGLMMARPLDLATAKANLDVSQLATQWQHWLPDEVKLRLDDEDDTSYVTRLHIEALERGLVTDTGKAVDVFAKVGLNLKDAAHRAAAEAWAEGTATTAQAALTAALNDIKFDTPDSAGTARMVMVAQARAAEDVTRSSARKAAADRAIVAALDSAKVKMPEIVADTREVTQRAVVVAESYSKALSELATLTRTGADAAAVKAADAAVSHARAALDDEQKLLLETIWNARSEFADLGSVVLGTTAESRAKALRDEVDAAKTRVENIRGMLDAVRLGQDDALTRLDQSLKAEVLGMMAREESIASRAAAGEEARVRVEAAKAMGDARVGNTTRKPVTARDVIKDASPFPRETSRSGRKR